MRVNRTFLAAIEGGAGTGPWGRERPPGLPGAAVHRHILYRMNTINDSLNKKIK